MSLIYQLTKKLITLEFVHLNEIFFHTSNNL